MRFTYEALPMRVVFGAGSSAELGDEIARLGLHRVLVLCTPGQVATADRVVGPLGDRVAGVFPGARMHVPAEVAARLAEHLGEEDLTPRELEVLRLIQDGHKNKQIADQLCISENTVNFHIKNLVDKLGARDRTHAVTIAVRRGLLPL